jgi:GntR family transcriptional regulator
MLFRVDPTAAAPLAGQIAAQVRGGLARGDLTAGERLPAARDLATALDVNMHTVLRAYSQLRDEGLIELRRGRGAVIRGHVQPGHALLVELAHQLVAQATQLGLTSDQIHAIITEAQS